MLAARSLPQRPVPRGRDTGQPGG